MEKTIDKIKVEKVIELFAPNMFRVIKWDEFDKKGQEDGRGSEYTRNYGPSLLEQIELVNKLKDKFVFDGRDLTLYGEGKPIEFIPNFNFFLLTLERARNEVYLQRPVLSTNLEIRIRGFTYFSDLKTFVENSNGVLGEPFFILLKDFDVYKDVIYRFALIDYKGNKTYVNQQVFFIPTNRALDFDIRDPSLLYSFEIPFLCEFYERDISKEGLAEIDEQYINYTVGLFTSVVDIKDYLSITIATDPLKRTKRGTILYDNKEYFYYTSYENDCRIINMKEQYPQEINERTL